MTGSLHGSVTQGPTNSPQRYDNTERNNDPFPNGGVGAPQPAADRALAVPAEPLRVSSADAASITGADAQLIHEALQFLFWAAGEGICPVESEGVCDPEESFWQYGLRTDDEEWETIADRWLANPVVATAPMPPLISDDAQLDGINHSTDNNPDLLGFEGSLLFHDTICSAREAHDHADQ